MRGCWPEQLGGTDAPGKWLHIRFISPGWQAPFSASGSLTTSTWWAVGISLCHASVVGRGLSSQAPVSTLIPLKGKIRNSTTSGLCTPSMRALSEPPISIAVPGAWLALVSPSKIVIRCVSDEHLSLRPSQPLNNLHLKIQNVRILFEPTMDNLEISLSRWVSVEEERFTGQCRNIYWCCTKGLYHLYANPLSALKHCQQVSLLFFSRPFNRCREKGLQVSLDIKGKGREERKHQYDSTLREILKKDPMVCFAKLLTVPWPEQWGRRLEQINVYTDRADQGTDVQTVDAIAASCDSFNCLQVTAFRKKIKRKKEGVDLSCSSQVLASSPGRGIRALSATVNPRARQGRGLPSARGGAGSFLQADYLSPHPSDSKSREGLCCRWFCHSPFIPLPSSWNVLRAVVWSSKCSLPPLPEEATLLCGDRGAWSDGRHWGPLARKSSWDIHPCPRGWFGTFMGGVRDTDRFKGLWCAWPERTGKKNKMK